MFARLTLRYVILIAALALLTATVARAGAPAAVQISPQSPVTSSLYFSDRLRCFEGWLFGAPVPFTRPMLLAQTDTPTPEPVPTSPPTPTPILLTDPVPDPHQDGVVWFSATGHTLRGSFLDYWQTHGGLAQFGYPITEEFTDAGGGGPEDTPLAVQYFERARFEHHPENAGSQYEVLLGALGKELHPPDPPAPPQSGAHYFGESGHNLSGAFLDYWQTHGGLAVNGYPITEAFEEQNPANHKTYPVQYFERARMEWHPENTGSPYEVLLGALGTQASQKRGYPYGWYPLYGHADDFSWVAGSIQHSRMCMDPTCSCLGFIWGYNRGSWLAGAPSLYPRAGQVTGGLLVLFGHLTRPGDPPGICRPAYVVSQIQANPLRYP